MTVSTVPSFTLQMTLGRLQEESDFFDYQETEDMDEATKLNVRYESTTDVLMQNEKIDTYQVSQTNAAFLAELYRLSQL